MLPKEPSPVPFVEPIRETFFIFTKRKKNTGPPCGVLLCANCRQAAMDSKFPHTYNMLLLNIYFSMSPDYQHLAEVKPQGFRKTR